jgi:hypothetical protein
MRVLAGLYFFYQKLIFPPLIISIILSLLLMPGPNFFKGTGTAFIILFPVVHYYTYDIRKPQEYYFYYNLGLDKPVLWIITVILGFLIGILLVTI